MDLYILDSRLRRTTVVDRYNSLIWSERFNEFGDFELKMANTASAKRLFKKGLWFVIPKSHRVMIVSTVESNSADGILTITGSSLESILSKRMAAPSLTKDPTTKWELTGFPQVIAKKLFTDICVTGVLSLKDKIPNFSTAAWLPLGTIATYPEQVKFELEIGDLYSLIQQICKVYDLGFRLVWNDTDPANPTLHFDIYYGTDRSTAQTAVDAVVFDEELENLSDVKELDSEADYYNVAYVYGKNKALEVYADGVDVTLEGFERNILYVKADDITLTVSPELDAALIRRGRTALSEHRRVLVMDGEISQSSNYIYGTDYDLGDIVEIRGSDGLANVMRVTEQIFVSDETGVKSYPSLSMLQTLTPETWSTWPGTRTWSEIPETDLWSTI